MDGEEAEKDHLTMIMIVLVLVSLTFRIFVSLPYSLYYTIKQTIDTGTSYYIYTILKQYLFFGAQQVAVMVNVVRWAILLLTIKQIREERLVCYIKTLFLAVCLIIILMIVASALFVFSSDPTTKKVTSIYS